MDDMRSRYRTPRRDYTGSAGHRPSASSSDQPMFEPVPRPQPAEPKPISRTPQPLHHPPAEHHRPAEHHPKPTHPEPAAAHRQTRKKSRRGLKILLILVVLAGLGSGGFWGYQKLHVQNPFPEDARSQTKLDLLYPTKLPIGYTVNKQNISLSNGILIYDATNKSGNRLVFTIQATPSNFNFDSFYKQQLTNRQQYNTNYGSATVGKNSNRVLGSLVDDSTWLLLSTNSSDVTFNDMSLVLTHLKKY